MSDLILHNSTGGFCRLTDVRVIGVDTTILPVMQGVATKLTVSCSQQFVSEEGLEPTKFIEVPGLGYLYPLTSIRSIQMTADTPVEEFGGGRRYLNILAEIEIEGVNICSSKEEMMKVLFS